ncbi:MAG TPA: helix-turn-helix domain-containing protein [Candidatus Limnocylindrales bacterium]|nr:helix-turn-helix domain-containing protein [Candidatus Limnocylindrales bacterium]
MRHPAPTDQAGPPPTSVRTHPAATPSTLRRAILLHLRQAGPCSPDTLAAALGASRTGVLQQLHALEEARLVGHAAEKHGVGRPRHVYDVTADAQDLFPADYGGFASGLLKAIASIGGDDLVEQVFEARRRQIGDRARRKFAEQLPADAPLVDRARLLAVLQDDAGYLAEAVVDAEGVIRLREHNCAIDKVAKRTPYACDAELALFRELLGPDVVRETHIASGDRCCSYRVGVQSGPSN